MGVSYYNPTGRLGPTIPRQGAPTDPETEEERARRIAASRYGGSSTPAPTPTPTPAPAPAPSGGTGTGPETEAERARRIAESRYDGGSPSAPTATTAGSGESEGIGEWLSKTRIGGGLGVVLNNPYVKGVLQGASVLGTAGAFTASLGNEIGDAIRGEGFSPQDLYDQTNPLFFLHGENEEDKFGWGDTWREQGQALGAGDNKWVDAGIGFAGDLSLDPANYIGIGLVDKGLDALRAGSRLGAVLKGGDAAASARAVAASVADGTTTAARVARTPNPQAGRGTSRVLAGRQTRQTKISNATQLISRAIEENGSLLDELYGGSNVGARAIEDLQYRARRGLGAKSPQSSPQVVELVETALNIKSPAVRMRAPKVPLVGRKRSVAIPGSGLAGEGAMAALGVPRNRFNTSRVGRARVRQTSPKGYERVNDIISQPQNNTVEDFISAANQRNLLEDARVAAGRTRVSGLRVSRSQRSTLLREVREKPFDTSAERNAAYVADIEAKVETNFGAQVTEVREAALENYGVTIPEIDSDLGYFPHISSPEFSRYRRTAAGSDTSMQFDEALGGEFGVGSLDESGRMQARNIGPNMELPVPGAPGKVFKTGDGSVGAINASAKAAQKKAGVREFRILEDSPIKVLEEYVDAVAVDVGKRAAMATQIALKNSDVAYNYANLSEAKQLEVIDEVKSAYARLGLDYDVDSSDVQRILNNPDLAASRTNAEIAAQVRKVRKIESDGGAVTDAVLLDLQQNMATPGWLKDNVDMALKEWMAVGENALVMMDPRVQDMMQNIVKAYEDPGMLGKLYLAMNRYFKNFAVLTPGFHFRNGYSASFMNIADGVPIRTTIEGIREWGKFAKATRTGARKNAEVRFLQGEAIDVNASREYIKALRANGDDRIADALDSVMGSGTSRFRPHGYGA